MVSWEHVVLWVILYTIIAVLLSRYVEFGDNKNITGPILTIRSQKGLGLVEKMASKWKKPWHIWGILGVISAFITAIAAFLLITLSVYGLLTQPDDVGIEGPTDMIVIPGVNRFLPVEAAPEIVLGLLIAMVVHEGGHAIYCRLGNINIKSTGVILAAFIPLGAFVEPDEEEQFEAEIPDQLKMYAAGIMNNYAIFVVCIVGMFVLVPALISPVTGIAVGSVLSDSPAENAGIEAGDVIVGVNGVEINNSSELNEVAYNENGIDNITTRDNETVSVEKGAYIVRSPEVSGLLPGSTIVEYNDNDITNARQLSEKIQNEESETVEIVDKNNETSELRIGAHVTAQDEYGIAEQMNMDIGDTTILHKIDDENVYNQRTLSEELSQNVDEEVEIKYWEDDDIVSTNYTVEEDGVESLLVSESPSGVSSSNLGIENYPQHTYYNVFSFGDSVGETAQNVYTTLIMPIGSLTPGVTFNFPGFTPFIQNFYTVGFGGAIASWFVFFTVSVLFWSSWINFNLALFNCLPTFALDGGFILKASVEWIPIDMSESTEKWAIIGLKFLVLVPLILLLLGPLLL